MSPCPEERVTFEVDPDCAALCKKKDVPLPELPFWGHKDTNRYRKTEGITMCHTIRY